MQDHQGKRVAELADAEWLKRPATRAVFAALRDDGHKVRAVGGAVRNTLLGRAVADIDLATPALPDIVMRVAEKAAARLPESELRPILRSLEIYLTDRVDAARN